MKTIIKGKTSVIKLLGKQKVKNAQYRLMKYVLKADCEDGILLHNCVTGQLVLLSLEEYSMIDKKLTGQSYGLDDLIEDYFLVPESYDEKNTVDSLRFIMKRLFTPKGINGYTIMTTTNCNARCFYCYQAGYKHINMSKEIAEQLLDYMLKHKGQDSLHLQWFGGEPLVGIARIDQISNELTNKGVSFTSSMISNGYLFNDSIIERAVKNWKLRNIQITLDGTEEVYNRTKSYISPEDNPYRRVLRNINLLLKNGVHVGVRLNLDQHNSENLFDLVDDIIESIPDKRLLNVYAHVIYEDEGYSPIPRNTTEREQLYKMQLLINKKIIESDLAKTFTSLPSLKYRSCMADNPRSMLIYPDGHLFKCEHVIEGDQFGHLNSSLIDESRIEKFSKYSNMKMCCECPLYPSCLILKECDGLKDRNAMTCGFEVETKARALEIQYIKYKGSGNNLIPETDVINSYTDVTNC